MPEFMSDSQLINSTKVLGEIPLASGMKVIDLGAGNIGHMVFPAARLVGSEGLVYALDIRKEVLQSIESRASMAGITNVELLWGDFERPGGVRLTDGQFDVVLIVNNLGLSKERTLLIREANRLLKLSGKLLLIDWQIENMLAGLGPAAESRISSTKAQQLFIQNGFTLDHEFKAGDYHFGQVFNKTR